MDTQRAWETIDWLVFNGTSTQNGQFVPTAGKGNRLKRLWETPENMIEIKSAVSEQIEFECSPAIPVVVAKH